MDSNPYHVPVDELEDRTRVPRTEQVTSVADGAGPPPVHPFGTGDDAADGDGD